MTMFVTIGINERHEEPIDVVDILWMSSVVLYQLSNDVSNSAAHKLIMNIFPYYLLVFTELTLRVLSIHVRVYL